MQVKKEVIVEVGAEATSATYQHSIAIRHCRRCGGPVLLPFKIEFLPLSIAVAAKKCMFQEDSS